MKKNIEKEESKKMGKTQIKKSFDIFKERNDIKAMLREEQKFFKNSKTVPDFMLDKLKSMPENKGYIWRDIWCFGDLPATSRTITMFEKRGQVLTILEVDDNYRTVFEKIGKSPKVLVERIPRKKLNSSILLF